MQVKNRVFNPGCTQLLAPQHLVCLVTQGVPEGRCISIGVLSIVRAFKMGLSYLGKGDIERER